MQKRRENLLVRAVLKSDGMIFSLNCLVSTLSTLKIRLDHFQLNKICKSFKWVSFVKSNFNCHIHVCWVFWNSRLGYRSPRVFKNVPCWCQYFARFPTMGMGLATPRSWPFSTERVRSADPRPRASALWGWESPQFPWLKSLTHIANAPAKVRPWEACEDASGQFSLLYL